MIHIVHATKNYVLRSVCLLGVVCVISFTGASTAGAITPLPIPDPQPGGYGLEATKTQEPPTQGATITTPGNGAAFSDSPITVRGICPTDLLVQVYNNNVMVGAVMCQDGSFSIEVSLFAGTNELKAIVYDDLEQAGPESDTLTVTYNDTRFTAFGQLITLTSSYGRRSAPVGSQLVWPLQLSGGTGPYAFSVDWGDNSESQLLSHSFAGALDIAHIYKKAGIYQVNVRVTDSNGVSAFLQVIAVSSGQVEVGDDPEVQGSDKERVIILWIPAAAATLLLFPAFWLGRRSHLISIRNKMVEERDKYKDQ